jgi:hypothetical protein
MIREFFSDVFGIEIMRIKPVEDPTYYDEQKTIKDALEKLNDLTTSNFVIDIGASDGISSSNTYRLFKNGASGIAVEPDSSKFSMLAHSYKKFNVNLFKGFATPDNVISILKSSKTPKEPLFLNFDIDSYDYFVLQKILEEYRPSLISTEINETIPIPFKFAVMPNSDHKYFPGDHFYGMSISMLGDLCKNYSYDIIGLNYINAFLVPHEKNLFTKALTPDEAYRTGYWDKHDRKEKFPWNANMEELHSMDPDTGMKFIRNFFLEHEGKYILTI